MTHFNYTKDELQYIISISHSWNDVMQKIGMKTITRSFQRRIKKDNINYNNISSYFDGLHTIINKISKEEIEKIIKNNTDWAEVMKQLGYKSCLHIKHIKKKLDKLNINYEHLILISKNILNLNRYTLEEILVKDSQYTNMTILFKRLKKERNWEHKCYICNLTEWNGKPIPLEIDHIDGCHTNNTYENLRSICPNCHAQTDTYKGKNMKICKIKYSKKNILNESKICINTCLGCNKIIKNRNKRCIECKHKYDYDIKIFCKVERPPYELLKEDLSNMSMVKVGKKYGVSDNTVRKWVQTYEKYKI